MSAGLHLDLFDFAGAESIQEEARELRRAHFNPSAVSAGIDLLLNVTRRGDVGRAGSLVDDVAEGVAQGQGWHGWLWRLRFHQLRAEMAAARGEHAEALELAREAISHSRSKRRVKYETYGRVTLAQSPASTGRKREALVELGVALTAAERLGNPALQVLVAGTLLTLEPDQSTAIAGCGAVSQVLAELSDPLLRQRFLSADGVRVLASSD